MKPIYFTLDNGRAIIVVPETQIVFDGHPILSLNYNIYTNEADGIHHGFLNTADKIPQKADPNYLGFITFEHPGKMYTYTSDSDIPLDREEVEEAIELISYIRDNPDTWRNSLN